MHSYLNSPCIFGPNILVSLITDVLPVQAGIVKQTILPKLINYVLFTYLVITLVNVYVVLVVFTHIAGTS